MLKSVNKILHYYTALGMSGAAMFIVAKLKGTQPLFKASIPGIKYPIFVRISTTDASVLRQVLFERHYDFELKTPPKVIIDAGANIGLASIFFANRYPDATIIAIEPEVSNFGLLEKNVQPYPRIKAVHAALWKENGEINLVDPGLGHHGFQTTQGDNSQGKRSLVRAVTVDSLMKEMGIEHVDVLKIDVEGAEKDVFEHSGNWIEKVDIIMAELHDHLRGGCSAAFENASREFGDELIKGETIMRSRSFAI